MDCAGKQRGTDCAGPATRCCNLCGAVAYCSVSHQIAHWSAHKEECARLKEQMKQISVLNYFPFTFTEEATLRKQDTRCSFLSKKGIHLVGMWMFECHCCAGHASFHHVRSSSGWHLPSGLCPCSEPVSPLSTCLDSWDIYYQWRCIPLHSPVALLLHWPLTIYHAIQLAGVTKIPVSKELHIHYLGPEKELLQLEAFGELHALFPGVKVHVEFVGPAVPQYRDNERLDLHGYAQCLDTDCVCKSSRTSGVITVRLNKGFYHDHFKNIAKDSFPHIIIAPNAGLAVHSSWLPTIELIKELKVEAVFSDYCEEASQMAANFIHFATGNPLKIPIQLNPFRQPMALEGTALILPCFSNCFLFGI